MAVSVAGMTAKQALEKRADIITNVQKMKDERGDDWTSDDDTQFDEMMTDAEKLADHAKRSARLELAQKIEVGGQSGDETDHHGSPNNMDPAGGKGEKKPEMVLVRVKNTKGGFKYEQVPAQRCGSKQYQDAFGQYIKYGRSSPALIEAGTIPSQAIQSDSGPEAGYMLSSEQFAAGVLKEVDDLLFIRQYSTVHTVRESGTLGIRARNARLNTFDWGPELKTAEADTSLRYGKRSLSPHYLTGSAELSRDLIRRTLGGAEAEVRGELARDGGEKMEDAYLTGDGNGKPLGVFTQSADGIGADRDVVTGANDGFTFDGLVNAKYSMKQQYRRQQRGGVRWLMHRLSIRSIVLIKDNDDQPLFRVGAGRQQDTNLPEDELLGYPVDESERAPGVLAAGQYGAILAAWRYYEIADALDMELQALFETQARRNMVEYIARLKTDGMPTLSEAFVRLIFGT